MSKLFETLLIEEIPDDPVPSISRGAIIDFNHLVHFFPIGISQPIEMKKLKLFATHTDDLPAEPMLPSISSQTKIGSQKSIPNGRGASPKSCPNKIRKTLLGAIKEDMVGFSNWI